MAVNPLPPFVATNAVAVTPDDVALLNFFALYIGITGDVAITTYNGQTVTFTSVPVGFFPVGGTVVLATGTSAANIIALF